MSVPFLFLREPCQQGEYDDGKGPNPRLAIIERLEAALQALLVQDKVNQKEARTWLITSISKLQVSHRAKRRAFRRLLDEELGQHRTGAVLTQQFFLLLCESPLSRSRVARLLAKDASFIREFFADDNRRIVLWFQHFAGPGGRHKLGARALAHYALANRDECWDELAWGGWHAQSPVMVASKPHYFGELQVVPTVLNWLRNVPAFWRSDELRESLESGEFLSLDYPFFAEELQHRLMEGSRGSNVLWDILQDYLEQEELPILCKRLLHLCPSDSLLKLLQDLNEQESQGRIPAELAGIAGVTWQRLDDAMLANACAAYGRQVLRLFSSEDQEDENQKIDSLAREVAEEEQTRGESSYWAVRRKAKEQSPAQALKLSLLEAFLLRWRLNQLQDQPVLVEALLKVNSLEFEKAGPDVTSDSDSQSKRRYKRRRKKKRKRSSSEADDQKAPKAVSWKLGIEGWKTLLPSRELLEYLADYSLTRWLERKERI